MAGELFRSTAQVGVETTYGTPVAATRIVYLNDQPVLTREREPRPRMFATGDRQNQRAATLGPTVVGGNIRFPLSSAEIIEWLLITLQGGVTPTTPTGATNGRLWTFGSGGLTLDSATLEYNDGATAYRGYGIYGNSLTIEGSANAEAMCSVALFGIERSANALTGSLTQRVPTFIDGYETISFVDALGGTPGNTQIPSFLTQWSLTFTNNLDRKYLADNRNRMNRAVLGAMGVTAQLTIEAANAQAAIELANWDNVTKRLVTLRFGGNTAIAGETPVNNVQTLTMNGTPTGGTIVMQMLGQQFTLAYNSASGAAQTAINNALAALGSGYSVTVSGGAWPGSALVVTASGNEMTGKELPAITTVTNSLTGGTTPNVSVAQTTPGYSGKETIWVDLPGFWSAADVGGTNAGTRCYQMTLNYLYDPTNAFGFRIRCLNGRATAW